MKNVLVISGTYRKSKSIDTLIDKAIQGIKQKENNVCVEIVRLIDKKIQYCTNCMSCRNQVPVGDKKDCVLPDEMQDLYDKVLKADYYIFASPINMGTVTAIMKTFLERCCWVFAKPNPKSFPIKGIPAVMKKDKQKYAVIILSTGLIPPVFRKFCDDATSLIKIFCKDHLNAKLVGSLYAGAVEKRGVDHYFKKAVKLGEKLIKW